MHLPLPGLSALAFQAPALLLLMPLACIHALFKCDVLLSLPPCHVDDLHARAARLCSYTLPLISWPPARRPALASIVRWPHARELGRQPLSGWGFLVGERFFQPKWPPCLALTIHFQFVPHMSMSVA